MTLNPGTNLKPTRILLVDDHGIVREGLRRVFSAELDLVVVGEAADGHTALQLEEQLQPHIVVMDIGLPDGDGLAFARQMLAQRPALKIIILSALTDRAHLDAAVEAGIAGYLLKVNASNELIDAVRAAMKGSTFLSLDVSAMLLGGYKALLAVSRLHDPSALSDREAEVLKLIADGCNTKQIADELGLSVKTVETHRTRIMAKLNLHSVAELTKYAVRKGLSTL
jgi:two-component system, NarL family, response regulator NreC